MAIVAIGRKSIAEKDPIFDEVPEFSKDMKKLNKEYNTIYDDLETFKKALSVALPDGLPGIVPLPNLGNSIKYPVYKVRKFHCKALKGKGAKSGIRLIYTYYPSLNMIYFIEAYHKNQQENEDRKRIFKYLQGS
jgi:mRNA-degrading endonuclease RelE of RelBE toxin-antitoxin system